MSVVDKPIQTLLPSDQQLLAQNQGGEPVDPRLNRLALMILMAIPISSIRYRLVIRLKVKRHHYRLQQFHGDLGEQLHEDDLTALGFDLVQKVEEDKRGRNDWIEFCKDGLKYLGIKEYKKATPWMGACATTHPMMLEGIVRYQSRALVKLFPSEGPAKLDIEANLDQPNARICRFSVSVRRRPY